jgi:DNA-binding response OmpR family regulator
MAGGEHEGDGSQASHAAGRRPPSGLRALVVEDEQALAALVGSYLENDGFSVSVVHDGLDAVDTARRVDPDVVVLDLGLPGLDGLEVCRRLRTFSDAYVVMLTARSEEVDTLIGLSVGADDYMTKPFSPRELMARVQTMFRRPRAAAHGAATTGGTDGMDGALQFGALTVDPLGRDVWLDGEPVALTRTEFDLLATLAERPRMAFSRRQLIEAVWGPSWVGDEHLVDVHVGHLRRKLDDDPTESRFVRTVRGVGYRMGTGQ